MSNSYHSFNFWPATNIDDGHSFGANAQPLLADSTYDHFRRIQQYVMQLEAEKQHHFAMLVQMEQEKRAILAWGSQIERENITLRVENAQLIQQLKDTTENRRDEGQTNRKKRMEEEAKEKPLRREMNSEEQLSQIISTILDNHSPLRTHRRRLATANGAAAATDLIVSGENNATEDGDIQWVGIVPTSSSSMGNEFPPPPKTPPPPVTPPLPSPPKRSAVGAKMSGTVLKIAAPPTTDEQHIVVSDPSQQQPAPAGNSNLVNSEENGGNVDNAHHRNDDAQQGGGGGGAADDEVLFVDDVCRYKWMPSMEKKEPRTEWAEIVVEEEDGGMMMDQAAVNNNNAGEATALTAAIAEPARVKEEIK